MEIDPIVAALATVVTGLAGVLYRELVRARHEAEKRAEYWERRALGQAGLARMGVEEAEKREAP